MLSISLLLCLFVGLSSQDQSCQLTKKLPDIDWQRMPEGTWYDGMDVNEPTGSLDCWDWKDIKKVEGGFEANAEIRMFGKEEKKILPRRFIEVENNTFVLHRGSKATYMDTLRKIRINRKEILGREDINIDHINADKIWSFITDYENYFIGLKCTGAGWAAYPKTRKTQRSGGDVALASNILYEYGICGPITYKTYCMDTVERI